MRYSYGIMDRRKILLYKPQLFLKGDATLIFPSRDFIKWHGDIKEFIDGLYQINSETIEKTGSINMEEFNLAMGVIYSITEELEQLFNSEMGFSFSYQYISTVDNKFKKRRKNNYNNDMRKCDLRIPVKPEITRQLKHKHQMEIVEEAWKLFVKNTNIE